METTIGKSGQVVIERAKSMVCIHSSARGRIGGYPSVGRWLTGNVEGVNNGEASDVHGDMEDMLVGVM